MPGDGLACGLFGGDRLGVRGGGAALRSGNVYSYGTPLSVQAFS